MDLLTKEEVRTFYDNLLTKPGYIKVLRESINTLKMEQIVSYAEKVNRVACQQLESDPLQCDLLNLYLKKHQDFEFPPFTSELTKHCDYSEWTYKEKLNYWFESSMVVLGILNGEIPKEAARKPDTKEKIVDGRVCPIWCYAYFHLIWEKKDPLKVFPMYSKKEIVRRAKEIYGIDGRQFYNQYLPICNVSLINSIRDMDGRKREELKTAVYNLAEIFKSPLVISWWSTNII